MNTYLFLLLYFLYCALINLLIPSEKKRWTDSFKEFKDLYKSVDEDSNATNKLKRGILKALKIIGIVIGYVIVTPLSFILTPIIQLIPFITKHYEKKRTLQDDMKCKIINLYLYFRNMGGAGTINCLSCGHQEWITSFIHGFNENGVCDGVEGYQCQSCGKFRALDFEKQIEKERQNIKSYCDCGGELEKNKPLFCPQCKSKNVKYFCEIIT